MSIAAADRRNAAISLASAVITSSPFPLVLLDGELTVLVASASFCEAYGVDAGEATGRPFLQIGTGEWGVPELRALLMTTVGGGSQVKAYALDLHMFGTPVRRVLLNAQKLDYVNTKDARLLLGVMEATDAPATALLTDKLHREAVVLLQEVRHRAANSLQIIASVILLTAKRSKSEEVRIQLNDAHRRIMSLAELDRHLAPSDVGDVALRPYLRTALSDQLHRAGA